MTEQPVRRRLFVAVWPPVDLVDQLEAIDRPPARGLRWTTRDQWHVTLRFVGRIDDDSAEALAAGLSRVAASPAFERPVVAVAGPEPQMLGRGVWMLPVSGLDGLAGAVEGAVGSALPAAGPSGETRPFQGHLTLARAKRPTLLRGLPRPGLAGSWEVNELTLVNSTLHPSGARYDVVQRWNL